MAKNPFMSAYLSAANRAANTARGKATVQVKRAAKQEQTSMVNAWADMMTGGATRRRRKRR
jgi:predicted alpha-1,6-mannanase (GH76 family)